MQTYTVGHNDKSKTGRQVLVTIRTTELTDMTDFKENPVKKYECYLSDFYMSYGIDVGYVEKITDLLEDEEYNDFTTSVNGKDVVFCKGRYFKLTEPRSSTDPNIGVIHVFKHKLAAVNTARYISQNHTGVYYMYYPNGLVNEKIYYKSGEIQHKFYYRNDTFNSLRACLVYNNASPETEYSYDTKEALIQRNIYDKSGKLLTEHKY